MLPIFFRFDDFKFKSNPTNRLADNWFNVSFLVAFEIWEIGIRLSLNHKFILTPRIKMAELGKNWFFDYRFQNKDWSATLQSLLVKISKLHEESGKMDTNSWIATWKTRCGPCFSSIVVEKSEAKLWEGPLFIFCSTILFPVPSGSGSVEAGNCDSNVEKLWRIVNFQYQMRVCNRSWEPNTPSSRQTHFWRVCLECPVLPF